MLSWKNGILAELVLAYYLIILRSEPVSKWDYSETLAIFDFESRVITRWRGAAIEFPGRERCSNLANIEPIILKCSLTNRTFRSIFFLKFRLRWLYHLLTAVVLNIFFFLCNLVYSFEAQELVQVIVLLGLVMKLVFFVHIFSFWIINLINKFIWVLKLLQKGSIILLNFLRAWFLATQ